MNNKTLCAGHRMCGHQFKLNVLCGTALAAALAAGMPGAYAQSGPMLDDIVVTAQKREQTSQDVPISLSATDGKFIADAGIGDIEVLSAYVPNLTVTTSPGISQIMIRGVGSAAATRSFEQSVGLYIDGIYSPRSVGVHLPFLDVERVEVLRGPQGVLFGKNSIAGAISVISAKPTDEFEVGINGKYEFEYGSYQVDGFVSGPVTDRLFVRVAAIVDKNEGYVEPVVTGGDDQSESELSGVRGTVVWEPTDSTRITTKAEYFDNDTTGTTLQMVGFDPTAPRSGLANYIIGLMDAAGEDYTRNDRHYSDFVNSIDQENTNVTVELEQGIGSFDLTYLFGFSKHDRVQNNAFDFSAGDIIIQTLDEQYEQQSHELRLSSPQGEVVEFTLGAFYIDRSLSFPGSRLRVNLPPLPVPPPSGALTDISHTFERPYYEESDAWSVFGQATWNVTDMLRVTAGGRYTDETKSAEMTGTLKDPIQTLNQQTVAITDMLTLIGIANSPLGFQNFSVSGERNETSFDPSVNVQWDMTDEHMVYARWAQASKSGGFNNNDAAGGNFEFNGEDVTSYELGLKSRFWNGRAQANIALFYNNYDDLQVSFYDGTGFQTGNAARARVRGVELDSRVALTDTLTVGVDAAYLDAQYKDYSGPCSTNSNVWGAECITSGGVFQDLTGKQMDSAPKWSTHLFADNDMPIGSNLYLNTRFDLSYSSDYPLQTDQDPTNVADSLLLADARIGLDSADGNWGIALVARNLFDNRITAFGGSAPLLPGVYWGDITPPRQIELSFSWRFGG